MALPSASEVPTTSGIDSHGLTSGGHGKIVIRNHF